MRDSLLGDFNLHIFSSKQYVAKILNGKRFLIYTCSMKEQLFFNKWI